MVCENCKKQLDDNLNFCPYCGKPLQITDKSNPKMDINKVKTVAKEIYKDPDVREIVDDVKKMVVASAADTKKRVLHNASKQAKKITTKILKTTGLKKKNVFDHIKDSMTKK